ncbi:MAG: hypothetical protein ACRD5E_11170, partial [Nitrososphaeraceae archaeon]
MSTPGEMCQYYFDVVPHEGGVITDITIYELLDCSIWPSISQDLMKQPLSVNFCTLLGNPVKSPTFTLL